MESLQGEACNSEPKSDTPKLVFKTQSYLQSLGLLTNGTPVPKDFSIINADDSLSFEILGENSLDIIQASYADIQQKSMSIDYDSIISSLNPTEIHQKLSELLQENSMLKETLKQNNVCMIQQFNTMALWTREFKKTLQNHMKIFVETREYINHLTKENIELNMKLSMDRKDETEMDYKIVTKADCEGSSKEEQSPDFTLILQEKISLLTEELNNSKLKCAKLSSDIDELTSISDLTSSQLKQATSTMQEQRINIKKLELAALQNELEKSIGASCDRCSEKDKYIGSLKESVMLLESQLEHVDKPVQSCAENSLNSRIKQYNEKLQELTACIEKQIERSSFIEGCVKGLLGTLNVVEEFVNSALLKEESTPLECTDFHACKKQLSDYYRKIVEQHSELEEGRQETIKVQVQLKNILLEHSSLLYELETMLRDNKEATQINSSLDRETVQNERQTTSQQASEDSQSLEEERKRVIQVREKLEEERKLVVAEKLNLESEYKSLCDAKELLQQERLSLQEERTSLDQQTQLYEDQERTFQTEKKMLEAKYDQLSSETNALTEDIRKKELKVSELQKTIEQHAENVNLLQTQLKLYEEDFEHEKKIKELLLTDKRKLESDLQEQIEYNKQLQEQISRLKKSPSRQYGSTQEEAPLTPPIVSSFSCPKCDSTFRSVEYLQQHVEYCINCD